LTAPRLEINLQKIQYNATVLVRRLARRGIAVSGVTKATLGCPRIASAMLKGGVQQLADSRIENIEAMRQANVDAEMLLIRSPMLSQADRVVAAADVSFNTELDVIAELSRAAKRLGRHHGIVLMVELGDLREGVMPCDVENAVASILRCSNIALIGIGANLGCRSGIAPDARNMGELSSITTALEAKFGISLETVSGGNSSNMTWALNASNIGRVNSLRLGEAILLGNDPHQSTPIPGLHTDAIILVAEVIEMKSKPATPWGDVGHIPFPRSHAPALRETVSQAILAIGHQDVDPAGLRPSRAITVLSASSDHLIVDAAGTDMAPGTEVSFGLDYRALLRAMTSPYVAKVMLSNDNRMGDHRTIGTHARSTAH
jgi:predicted amino acid racemase